jgi:hypothetical protein
MASEIGRAFGNEVLVLRVREDELTWAMDVVLETEGEASELVDGIVRELKDAGVSVRREVVRAPIAHTARTILDVAKEEGAGSSSWAPAGSRTGIGCSLGALPIRSSTSPTSPC